MVAAWLVVAACDRPSNEPDAASAPGDSHRATTEPVATDTRRDSQRATIEPSLARGELPSARMTLGQAEEELLERFSHPELEARVEASYYATDAEILQLETVDQKLVIELRGDLDPMDAETDRLYGVIELSHLKVVNPHNACMAPHDHEGCTFRVLPERATTHFLWPLHDDFFSRRDAYQHEDPTPWPAELALWEAPTRERMILRSAGYRIEAAVTPTAWPSRTPTPRPALPPSARALGDGEVPSALTESASLHGSIPGSVWRYHVLDYDLRRGVHAVTEITTGIESAYGLGGDVMLVEGPTLPPVSHEPARSYLTGSGRQVSAPMSMGSIGSEPSSAPPSTDLPTREVCGLTTTVTEHLLNELGSEDVVVPAGGFLECCAEVYVRGNNSGVITWRCPEVGVVRMYDWNIQGAFADGRLYELIDYEIPPITPLP